MPDRKRHPSQICAAAIGAFIAAVSAGQADAQTRFTGQLGIYSVTMPQGWSELPKQTYWDAGFSPPGGLSQGGIFVGLRDAAPSLEAEADAAAEGKAGRGRRTLTLSGAPCITQQMSDSNSEQIFLACHIPVAFSDGVKTITFFMGSASPPGVFEDQSGLFYQAVSTVAWGPSVRN